MTRALRAWLALGAFVSACSLAEEPVGAGDDDDPVEGPDFPIRHRTQYVDVAPGFTQPVCRGTLDAVDRQVDRVASLLDIDVHDRFTLFWFNEHADGALAANVESREWCNDHSICTSSSGTTIYSNLDSLDHELVHATVLPAWGGSDVLFEEGLAHGLDGDHLLLPRDPSELPTALVGGSRHGGAHFSRWLLDRRGPASLRSLFEQTSPSSTEDEALAAVEAVYGVSLAELEAEYLGTAPTIYPALGLCDGLEHVPRQGNVWELATTVDCDSPRAFGPRDEDAARELSVTLELPAGIEGRFISVVEPSAIGELVPCIDAPLHDVADPDAVVKQWAVGNGLTFESPGGRYRFTVPVPEDGEIHVRICPWNGDHPTVGEVDPDLCLD
jgi:hypothetical protein